MTMRTEPSRRFQHASEKAEVSSFCAVVKAAPTDAWTARLQDRYLSDIENIVREEEAAAGPRRRIVMLSGGTDSLLLVVVLRHLFPTDGLHTIHMQGFEGDDSRGALAVASRFNTVHHVFRVTLDDLLENLHRVKG